MNRNAIVGTAVILACVAVGALALRGATVTSSLAFADVVQKPRSERCEVYGVLNAESIESIRGANTVRFELVEEKTRRRLPVLYDNRVSALPANFPNASHARVSGYYDAAQGRFVADTVLTKCPTKYDREAPTVRPDIAERWERAINVAQTK